MTFCLRTLFIAASAALLAVAPVWAQMKDNQERTLTCDQHNWGDRRLANHCEMQEQTLAAPSGGMQIDPGANGGVTIKGWSRNDVLVRARIETAAPSDSEARSLVPQVRVASGSGHIKAEGPKGDHDHYWSVSYEVFVPHQTDLVTHANNGGVRIQDIKGKVEFHAVNGGVHLSRVGGDVSGSTTNGGLTIELAGDRWDGKGMDVSAVNGGVKLAIPASYSARVEASTVNGNISVDFPVTVQGKIGNDLAFNLGSGGATIRAVTTNGGVKVTKI